MPECRKCSASYPEGGDGYNGLCPSCADRAEEPTNAERARTALFALGVYAKKKGDGTIGDLENGLILNVLQDLVSDVLHLAAQVENGGESVTDETFIGIMDAAFKNYESEI